MPEPPSVTAFPGARGDRSGSTSAAPADRIPVTLIGGYLGAGKTSLLGHLLAHAGGGRIAALVNDFGALGLDAALVARRDAETVTLTNGCVCCSIADDFGAALDAQVHSPRPPDRIVVETSGVADPGRSARYALGWPGVGLDAVVTVVDLETIRARATDRFTGGLVVRQIESADVLVANKSDRVAPPERRSTTDWLARHAPRAARIETCHGRVAPAVVLGVGMHDPDRPPTGPGHREARSTGASAVTGPGLHDPDRPPTGPGHREARSIHTNAVAMSGSRTRTPDGRETHEPAGDGHPPFVLVSCRTREPFDRTRLGAALDALPGAVARFKGIVRLRDRPGRPYVLQGVGRRWSLEPAPPHAPEALGVDRDSVIDLIGVGPAGPIESAARRIAPILRRRT